MIDDLFLSVGAMKAGTTWLYFQLKDHPDIFFTPEKEIHYFAQQAGVENHLNHKQRIGKLQPILDRCQRGNAKFIAQNVEELAWYAEYARPAEVDADWYEALFRFKGPQRYCADFSNLYCRMDAAGWRHVYDLARNVKVVYTLRDPIDRLWSHYKFHMKWAGREDEVLSAGFDQFRRVFDAPWFWDNAEYTRNVRQIRAAVPAADLRILYFEDFRSSPGEKLEEIVAFLGIDDVGIRDSALDEPVNATKKFPLPDEWREFLLERARPAMDEMKAEGIWHGAWKDA